MRAFWLTLGGAVALTGLGLALDDDGLFRLGLSFLTGPFLLAAGAFQQSSRKPTLAHLKLVNDQTLTVEIEGERAWWSDGRGWPLPLEPEEQWSLWLNLLDRMGHQPEGLVPTPMGGLAFGRIRWEGEPPRDPPGAPWDRHREAADDLPGPPRQAGRALLPLGLLGLAGTAWLQHDTGDPLLVTLALGASGILLVLAAGEWWTRRQRIRHVRWDGALWHFLTVGGRALTWDPATEPFPWRFGHRLWRPWLSLPLIALNTRAGLLNDLAWSRALRPSILRAP